MKEILKIMSMWKKSCEKYVQVDNVKSNEYKKKRGIRRKANNMKSVWFID